MSISETYHLVRLHYQVISYHMACYLVPTGSLPGHYLVEVRGNHAGHLGARRYLIEVCATW